MVHCDWTTVSFRNCVIVSVAFFFVFSGFNGAQRFATSAETGADERDISLAIIYSIIPFATLLVAPIIKRVSAHKVFFTATSCYALYIASNINIVPLILYICSVLVGIAAPCLWIARNVFITKCATQNAIIHGATPNSKVGQFNGIFWCIFQFSACLGSIIGGVLFQFNGSIVYLYALFTVVCICGVSTFCCIRPMNQVKQIQSYNVTEIQLINTTNTTETTDNIEENNDGDDSDRDNTDKTYDIMKVTNGSIKSELIQSGTKMIALFKQFNLWCMLPLNIYSGLEMAFDSADFPVLITDNTAKFYILGYYGLISVAASYVMGKISDNIHRCYIMLMLFIVHQIAWISLYCYQDIIIESQSNVIFVVLATIFGVGFAVIATQKLAIVPILLSNDPEVYQCIGLVESPAAAAVFYFHSYLDLSTKIIINSITLCIAVIPFFCFPSIRNALKPERNKHVRKF